MTPTTPHHHHHHDLCSHFGSRRLGSQVLRASVIFVDNLAGDFSMAARAPPTSSSVSSAVRRRERLLRSFCRHEQMAIQMASATVTHHSFQVGTAHDALLSQKLVNSAGGRRPLPLVEVRPSVRAQRHVVEQPADVVPMVQILDSPVPLAGSWTRRCRMSRPSQCPRSLDRIPHRSVDLAPQMVEQLVEVPTVLTPTRIALRIAEQIVDTPVLRGRDRRRLQGSLPRQSSTTAGVQNVDTPVRGDLRGFLEDRVRRSVLWSSSLTVLLEVFKIFTSVRALQLHPLVVRMRLFFRFFALFPSPKKVRRYVLTPGRNWPRTRAHPRRALMAW